MFPSVEQRVHSTTIQTGVPALEVAGVPRAERNSNVSVIAVVGLLDLLKPGVSPPESNEPPDTGYQIFPFR